MFKKADQLFDEMAADPVRRRKLIDGQNKARTMFLFTAVGLMLALFGLVVAMMANHAAQPSALLLVLIDAMMWNGYFRMESDLKLLRFIDRLQSRPGS